MNCRLCLSEKPLQNSHIIPEFMFRQMYDGLHRFIAISTREEEPNRVMQKGLREPLLCQDCEGLLSSFEKYSSEVLNGGVPVMVTQQSEMVIVEGIDYTRFKIFQLSILWRAAVSSLEYFSGVNLGNESDRIRRMILTQNAGEPYEYGVLVVAPLVDGNLVQDLIITPDSVQVNNETVYRFVMNGLVWAIYPMALGQNYQYRQYFLTREGRFIIPKMNFWDLELLADIGKKFQGSGKLEKGMKTLKPKVILK